MTLDINQVRNRLGATGADGISGTDGTLGTGDAGGNGTVGANGAAVTLALGVRGFSGGAGNDIIAYDYTATGGRGGFGGSGGQGASGQSSSTSSSSTGFVRSDTVWTAAGAGGAGR